MTYPGSDASGNYPETPREKEWFSEDFFFKIDMSVISITSEKMTQWF